MCVCWEGRGWEEGGEGGLGFRVQGSAGVVLLVLNGGESQPHYAGGRPNKVSPRAPGYGGLVVVANLLFFRL